MGKEYGPSGHEPDDTTDVEHRIIEIEEGPDLPISGKPMPLNRRGRRSDFGDVVIRKIAEDMPQLVDEGFQPEVDLPSAALIADPDIDIDFQASRAMLRPDYDVVFHPDPVMLQPPAPEMTIERELEWTADAVGFATLLDYDPDLHKTTDETGAIIIHNHPGEADSPENAQQ